MFSPPMNFERYRRCRGRKIAVSPFLFVSGSAVSLESCLIGYSGTAKQGFWLSAADLRVGELANWICSSVSPYRGKLAGRMGMDKVFRQGSALSRSTRS